MSDTTLPPRASLEYLRKLAKDRLAVFRQSIRTPSSHPRCLSVAQEHGFSSWRALRAGARRPSRDQSIAVLRGDRPARHSAVRQLLRDEPALIHARHSRHNATGLHHAASCGDLETVRVLLDAGADPNDTYDDARLGVIGWATFIPQPGEMPMDVVSLLLERGARHHIFSAIAAGDLDVIRALIEQQPEALDQRLSSRYNGQTPLHFAITRGRSDILDLLIEMGADLEAPDGNGQTALEYACCATTAPGRLACRQRAHSRPGTRRPTINARRRVSSHRSIRGATVVVGSRDVAATLAWYTLDRLHGSGALSNRRACRFLGAGRPWERRSCRSTSVKPPIRAA